MARGRRGRVRRARHRPRPSAPGGAAAAIASEPGEIVFAGECYDYEAKYTPGGMELMIPARISPAAAARVRELAVDGVRCAAGCEGLARVDFFVDGERCWSTSSTRCPASRPTSVYAKLLDASGVPYPELVDRLCRLASSATRARARYSY